MGVVIVFARVHPINWVFNETKECINVRPDLSRGCRQVSFVILDGEFIHRNGRGDDTNNSKLIANTQTSTESKITNP